MGSGRLEQGCRERAGAHEHLGAAKEGIDAIAVRKQPPDLRGDERHPDVRGRSSRAMNRPLEVNGCEGLSTAETIEGDGLAAGVECADEDIEPAHR